ncbi:MAG: ABC transporter substrate-binding protein, partial [Spirochaetota bacterium]
MTKKLLSSLVSGILILLLYTGCAQAGKNGPEFIIWNGGEPDSIDPHLITGFTELNIYMALFEGLLTYDPQTGEGIPGLAKSWTKSKDGKVYTFKLRRTTWSDGVKITADTVVKSWLKMLSPETAAPYAWLL